MYSGPQIFMIYYFPMTFCDYQNYGCGVLSLKPWFHILLHTQLIVCARVDSQCFDKEGSRMEGTLDFDCLDLVAKF